MVFVNDQISNLAVRLFCTCALQYVRFERLWKQRSEQVTAEFISLYIFVPFHHHLVFMFPLKKKTCRALHFNFWIVDKVIVHVISFLFLLIRIISRGINIYPHTGLHLWLFRVESTTCTLKGANQNNNKKTLISVLQVWGFVLHPFHCPF